MAPRWTQPGAAIIPYERETVMKKIRIRPMTNGEYIRRSEARQQDNHTRRQAAKKLGNNGDQR